MTASATWAGRSQRYRVVMTEVPAIAAPARLGEAGRALLESLLAEFDPEPDELLVLHQAAAVADTIDRLERETSAAPKLDARALSELRHQRTQLTELLRRAGLLTSSANGRDAAGRISTSEAASAAARARWNARKAGA